jgi:iron(III) transport system substrate-binding protein
MPNRLRKAAVALGLSTVIMAPAVHAAGEVNVYSYRQEFLIRPFLDAFERETGITVNVVFAKEGVLERIKAEGENTPADLVLTVDIGRLKAHKDAGVLQPLRSDVLEGRIPAKFRDPDGEWFGLSVRSRVLYVSKERVAPGAIARYEDLAEPAWRGKVCARSGNHPYNVALVASMLAHRGEAATRVWLDGLVANFARPPQGNDRAQVKAIMEGVCDVAIGNNYYMGHMMTNEKQPEQKEWAASARILFPNQEDRGAHVNVSGVGLVKWSKNKDNAIKLIEFLSSDFAQEMYAKVNFEYPVKDGVRWGELNEAWGRFKADDLSVGRIGELSLAAQKLVDEAGWQ